MLVSKFGLQAKRIGSCLIDCMLYYDNEFSEGSILFSNYFNVPKNDYINSLNATLGRVSLGSNEGSILFSNYFKVAIKECLPQYKL